MTQVVQFVELLSRVCPAYNALLPTVNLAGETSISTLPHFE